jgi:hypothetical protein
MYIRFKVALKGTNRCQSLGLAYKVRSSHNLEHAKQREFPLPSYIMYVHHSPLSVRSLTRG